MGRRAGIWKRAGRSGWWTTVGGRQTYLGLDRPTAERAFHTAKSETESAVVRHAGGPSFGSLIERFLQHVRDNRKPTTLTLYRRYLSAVARVRFDGAALKSLPAADLRPMHLTHAHQLNPQWGSAVRRMTIVQVGSVLHWSVRQGYLSTNPIAGKMEIPTSRSRGRESVVSPADFALLLKHARPRFAEVLTALRLTGCRPGEVAAVRAEDVDQAVRRWMLSEHKTDADGQPRIVHLSDAMATLTAELMQRHPTGRLFRNSRGLSWTAIGLNSAMRKTRKRIVAAGDALTGRVQLYGLRHTFATDLLTAGVPDAHVAALLGHRSTAMLHRHYNHLSGNAAVLRGHLKMLGDQ